MTQPPNSPRRSMREQARVAWRATRGGPLVGANGSVRRHALPELAPRRARLIATLGPSTDDDETVCGMIRAGLDVARINTAHGGPEDIRRRVEQIRRCAALNHTELGILLDLQGPKIRVGELSAPLTLQQSEIVLLSTDGSRGEDSIPISYQPLACDVKPGERILLNDGLLCLTVLDTDGKEQVRCRVDVGGILVAHKGVNLPDSTLSSCAPTPKDLEDATLGVSLGVDFLGLSFVRAAEDIQKLRAHVGPGVGLVAKIERPEALAHIDEIVQVSDAVMVARGDLGVELPLEEIPQAEVAILRAAQQQGTPAIVATELLQSMQVEDRPTRAEVTDIFYAVVNHADAVMLSAESAIGRHPVATVDMLGRLAGAAETTVTGRPEPPADDDVPTWVAYSAVLLARAVRARAIVTPTSSGRTAQQVARFRPAVPIIAVVPDVRVGRRLALTWGVTPVVAEMAHNTDEVIGTSIKAAREAGHIADGETVILTAGIPVAHRGTTNLVKVHRLGEAHL